jgi:hypothetical protein
VEGEEDKVDNIVVATNNTVEGTAGRVFVVPKMYYACRKSKFSNTLTRNSDN